MPPVKNSVLAVEIAEGTTVDVAQLVEPRFVVPVVAGSNPVIHPSRVFLLEDDALVAQLDRASDFESESRRFEPCRAYHIFMFHMVHHRAMCTQCESGGTGRRTGFRFQRPMAVGVRLPPLAPKLTLGGTPTQTSEKDQ